MTAAAACTAVAGACTAEKSGSGSLNKEAVAAVEGEWWRDSMDELKGDEKLEEQLDSEEVFSCNCW